MNNRAATVESALLVAGLVGGHADDDLLERHRVAVGEEDGKEIQRWILGNFIRLA